MDPFIGQIQLFAFGFAPRGWQLCDGSIIKIAENQALYSLLGNKFGGTPGQSFAVPNLLNASAYQNGRPMAYYIAIYGIYPSRS
ncbi:phage tail protein [Ruminiclostridium josui]|uniref:phage tail protein n=1 Tax=Ruminiclostridium josui TaxID=1499 RepID=UPI00046371FC|nr:tail fiber protein [Ruminiclostridium josui]